MRVLCWISKGSLAKGPLQVRIGIVCGEFHTMDVARLKVGGCSLSESMREDDNRKRFLSRNYIKNVKYSIPSVQTLFSMCYPKVA